MRAYVDICFMYCFDCDSVCVNQPPETVYIIGLHLNQVTEIMTTPKL